MHSLLTKAGQDTFLRKCNPHQGYGFTDFGEIGRERKREEH